MAIDEGLVEILRDDLEDLTGITEKRMFGGLAFMLNGNMVCGVHKGGGMFRVGKDNEAEALSIDGARPMDFTGRPMGGFVDVSDAAMADDDARSRLLDLALAYVRELPAK